jgi:hypothetical protein
VQARKTGSTLQVAVEPSLSFWATSLKPTIALPSLDGLRVTSGVRATAKGFKSKRAFQARVSLAATLDGEIEAPKVERGWTRLRRGGLEGGAGWQGGRREDHPARRLKDRTPLAPVWGDEREANSLRATRNFSQPGRV